MNKKLLFIIAFFFSFVLGYGQVVNYSFSQASGTYGAFSGVENYNWDDFVTENTIPIGFSFEFNGITHTTCSINSNGYITFGSTVSSATSYLPISSNGGYAGSISALGMDLEGRKYIVYGTTGTAPNRVFTVQWTEARRYEGRNLRNGDFNFQIRLNESSNVVQVVYGVSATNYDTDLNAQVGLRGLNNTDFNNRSVTNNWSSSAQGTINTASCRTGSGSGELPLNGLTYTWTPNPIITSFTPSNACDTSGVSVIITGRNFTGTTAVNFNGIPASFTINSNTQITAQLPATATTGFITVTTSGGTGTSLSSFTVSPPQGDQVTYGTGSWIGYVYANTNGGNPPSNAFTTTYRGYVTQTENFDLNLGDGALSGTNVCGSYTDNFAVKFKMNRNLPSGCYTFTVGGDDGYRLSLDGGLTYVINNWNLHSYQETTSTVYLSGTTNFVLEYFENGGQSRVRFLSIFLALGIPVVGAITQPTCALATGNVVLSGLPTSGTWSITPTPVTSDLTGLTGTGATTTVSGLTAGTTYTFAVSNGTCTAPVSSNVVIKPLPLVASYNGSWTNGPPTIEQSIVFSGNYTSIGNMEACECTVNAGVQVNVQSGHTLKITNAVKVNTTAGTSLTFENNASLLQINDAAVNTGNIIYKRKSGLIRKTDYTYWSSPVASQTLKKVSPDTNPSRFWSFNATANIWVAENSANIMGRGKGYIIRGPEFFPAPNPTSDIIQAPFEGVPHNGEFTVAVAGVGTSNLIGNPYPSALDAESFLIENSIVLQGTLYFWTHATEITKSATTTTAGMIDFVYTSDDYASFNLSGGVGTAAIAKGNTQSGSEIAANRPSGKIASGQAFFATGKVSGNAIFKNSMRVGSGNITGTNDQFYKTIKREKTKSEIERHRVWLNLTNDQGAFKQLLVAYITDATNGYDNAFDGVNNNGNQFVNFYSINEDKKLTIHGRALPFDEYDVVPLGYSSAIAGSFSISIDEVDGLMTSGGIYLEDKLTNMVHDLKIKAYTFSTEKGTFNDRFVLRYTNRTLGVGDFDAAVMQVLVSVKNKQIKINSTVETIDKVFIYDVLGKQIFEKTNVDALELVIPNLVSSDQVLIVKTVLQSGQIVTTKTGY